MLRTILEIDESERVGDEQVCRDPAAEDREWREL
jgi:hypothetical protein